MELGGRIYPASPAIPAVVPGAVNADLLREGRIPDPNIELDSQAGEWVTNREWVYEKQFDVSEVAPGQRYFLDCEGLDYWGEIWLNDVKLTQFEGMMIPVDVEVTEALRSDCSNVLKIIFYRVPEVYGQYGYTSRIQHIKSRFNYNWDWCSRVVPIGIWDDIYIERSRSNKIDGFYPKARLLEDLDSGELDLLIHTNSRDKAGYTVECVVSLQGKPMYSCSWAISEDEDRVQRKLPLGSVELWWPSGYGNQPLYEVTIRLLDSNGEVSDEAKKTVAFRRVEMNIDAELSEGAQPYMMKVNGRRVFIQGVNWVPISPLYGTVTREDYEHFIGRFHKMNVNMLRVWGGGILEKSSFYEVCDRRGILVWQELFQSSSGVENLPSDDPEFLEKLETTARVAIRRRRHHASLIIWCGGNELLTEDFKPIDGEHPNLVMLGNLVQSEDPDRIFVPASPWGPIFVAEEADLGSGKLLDVHGPWDYPGDIEHYRYFNADDAIFRSELGTPAASSVRTLEYLSGKMNLWPPDRHNRLWLHHGAWWIQWDQLQRLFGAWDPAVEDVQGYVMASQYVQAESLRYAAGAMQRRQPQAGGLLVWMGNEPFANTANTSVIEFNGRPKWAYSVLRQAFGPVHLSCAYDRVAYQPGEVFRAVVFLHDTLRQLEHARVKACVYAMDGALLQESSWSWHRQDGEQEVFRIGETTWEVEHLEAGVWLYQVRIEAAEELLYTDTYVFTTNQQHPFAPLRGLPPSRIDARWVSESVISVRNMADWAAVFIHAEETNAVDFIDISPNTITLLPNEERHIRLEPLGAQVQRKPSLRWHGLNLEPFSL